MQNELEVLLIEDNSNDVELTLRALRTRHLASNVIVLNDGADALEYFFNDERPVRGRTPKVIFLDLKLPKIGGLEVLRKMKSNEETKIIPIVILTSSREESDLIESYRLGVNSYIVKPLEFTEFAEAVANLGFYWMNLNKCA